MGVIYKLLKHRHLNMDLSMKTKLDTVQRKQKPCYRRILSIEGKILHKEYTEEEQAADMERMERRREAIVDMPSSHSSLTETKQALGTLEQDQQQHESLEQHQVTSEHITQLCRFLAENAMKKRIKKYDIASPATLDDHHYQHQHIRPYQHEAHNNHIEEQQSSHQHQHHHQQDNKRDILLKIRHQILERKRQRQQLALMQQGLVVWRPW